MPNGEFSFVLDRVINKNPIPVELLSREIGLGEDRVYGLLSGKYRALTNGDVERTQQIAEQLTGIFAISEPHRTFFIGLCHGKSLFMIARDTGLEIPADYVRAKL